jgi:hypothetical protein
MWPKQQMAAGLDICQQPALVALVEEIDRLEGQQRVI